MKALPPLRPWLACPLVLLLAACQASDDGSTTAAPPAEPVAATAATLEPSAPAPGEPASPWEAAAARGVVFRAVGNEPGWYAEVDGGEAPTLRATLDYGDRTVEVPRSRALDGDGLGYQGNTRDGTPVVMRIRREACSDGMSDQTYDTSVTLDVGDTTYRGCGRILQGQAHR